MTPTPRPRWLRRPSPTLLLGAVLFAALALLVAAALHALRAHGARAGFDFLWQPAGFDIAEGWLAFEPSRPLWQAIAAGLANTLRAALPAIAGATLLGTLVGLGRLANEPVLRALSTLYVEGLRNVPLLVQLLLGYFVLTHALPDADQPWQPLPGVVLSKSGLLAPWWNEAGLWQAPQRDGLGWSGGAQWTPEYLALLLGLTLYTAAFIAEVVRAGVQAVPQGQVQAAQALGLRRAQQLRHVVAPQALRLIVPALGNQWLNLSKNASLAVAIGYPDLVSVSNTALNQTGRAFECMVVLIAVYLGLSLSIAGLLALWNRRVLRGQHLTP